MSTNMNFGRDSGGFTTFGPAFSDVVFRTTLVANVAQNFLIPPPSAFDTTAYRRWLAVFSFSPGARVFVRYEGAATVPGAGFSSANPAVLNPAARIVEYKIDPNSNLQLVTNVLSFVSPDAGGAYAAVEFYAIQ